MKYIYLIFIFFLTLNCSLNKVSNNHGFSIIEKKNLKIIENKSNKNDVRTIVGPPSSVSNFENTWLYIERKKSNQSIFKLGKKKIVTNNILIIKFDNTGIVVSKELLTIDNMNDLKIADIKTTKDFNNKKFYNNILSTLREKINAPTRRKKK
tara:strand:- start:36 stop:491 length:456 start_codon:yes stop_codon:yes gene_type:complete